MEGEGLEFHDEWRSSDVCFLTRQGLQRSSPKDVSMADGIQKTERDFTESDVTVVCITLPSPSCFISKQDFFWIPVGLTATIFFAVLKKITSGCSGYWTGKELMNYRRKGHLWNAGALGILCEQGPASLMKSVDPCLARGGELPIFLPKNCSSLSYPRNALSWQI